MVVAAVILGMRGEGEGEKVLAATAMDMDMDRPWLGGMDGRFMGCGWWAGCCCCWSSCGPKRVKREREGSGRYLTQGPGRAGTY